jgi:hypothetical protein
VRRYSFLRTRYRFSHRAGDRYYWVAATRLPGDSRTEHVSCPVDWFWNRPTTAGEKLAEIMRDMDAASDAWVAAGYGEDTPEYEAREATFARLKEWNEEYAR